MGRLQATAQELNHLMIGIEEMTSQSNYRVFANVFIGLSLILSAFFPALGASACAVYWINRRGWRLLSASLLLVAVLLVYHGMTLVGSSP